MSFRLAYQTFVETPDAKPCSITWIAREFNWYKLPRLGQINAHPIGQHGAGELICTTVSGSRTPDGWWQITEKYQPGRWETFRTQPLVT